METEDKKLIQAYVNGNEEAFAKLLQKHLKQTYNFLYHLIADHSVLDDLTQETFIKAWKNIGKFDRSKNFRTWLFTIAKNTAYDYLKKKKAVPFSAFGNEEGENPLENISDESLLSDEILNRKELAIDLEKKINQLPAKYKTLLLLCYKDELSLNEIAEITGQPYNTVKSQHSRALASLKKILFK